MHFAESELARQAVRRTYGEALNRFFRKLLGASHIITPRVITVDKNAAYPKAFSELREEGLLADTEPLRQVKYLNNIVKQDHRFIKRLTNPGLGFASFHTAWRTLRGYEIMNMIRKDQLQGAAKGDVLAQNCGIAGLFGMAV